MTQFSLYSHKLQIYNDKKSTKLAVKIRNFQSARNRYRNYNLKYLKRSETMKSFRSMFGVSLYIDNIEFEIIQHEIQCHFNISLKYSQSKYSPNVFAFKMFTLV